MWNSNMFGLFLLGCCGVLLCSKPVVAEETTVKDDAVTLSTELQPPPVPVAGEPRGIVYLINLFAVRNKTAEDSEEKGENVLTNSDSPEVIGPLASILLVIDEEDDEDYIYDDLIEGQVIDDVLRPPKGFAGESRIPHGTEEPKDSEEKIKKPKKIRRKRTLFQKPGGNYNNYPTGGGGGYPQNNYNHNGGGTGQTVVGIPIVLVPVSNGGGGGQRREQGRGQGRGHGRGQGCNSCNGGGGGGGYNNHPSGGGGYNNHPSGGGYPSGGGGGYYPVGGGGGGSNSQAWAQASAGSSSYGNGR